MARNKKSKKISKRTKQKIVAIIVVLVIIIALLLLANYGVIPIGALENFIGELLGTPADNNQTPNNNQQFNVNPTGIGVGVVDVANFDEGLIVHFIDVGQGDCIFIEFPDDKSMIIDCGKGISSNYSDVQTEVISYIDALGYTKIDHLMLTHSDSDHANGLDEIIYHYDVDNIYLPNILASHDKVEEADLSPALLSMFTDEDTISTATYANVFIAALKEEGAQIKLNVGEYSISGADYTLDFYCYDSLEWQQTDLSDAEEKNSISPIGILTYKNRRVVLTGDATQETEEGFMTDVVNPIDCDVLKVGHHGSRGSSGEEFLDFIDCEYAVISCGKGNSHGHPHDEVASDTGRLYASGVQRIFRTDLLGVITLYVDENGNYNFATEVAAQATAD